MTAQDPRREARLGAGPFAGVVPTLVIAATFTVLGGLSAATGLLPGGRWPVVHLFTLGLMTNLVLVFSRHFARAITRSGNVESPWLLPALNVAVVGVLAGVPLGWSWLTSAGAGGMTAVVLVSARQLRRMRRSAPQARFAWLVRTYERAHGAFLLGALLGLLLGIGLLRGTFHGAVRLAHLHANIAGWVGLTLLGTIVFLGPAMARTRIPPGSEDRADAATRRAAISLGVALVALLASVLPQPAGGTMRLVAAASLAVYAASVAIIARLVVRLRTGSHRSPSLPLLVAAMAWFTVVAAADVVVVAVGAWRWMDVLGVAFGVGVAAQTTIAVVLYLLPSLRGRSFAARAALVARTTRGLRWRVIVVNAATAVIAAGAAVGGVAGAVCWRAGWAATLAVIVHTLALVVLRVRVARDPIEMSVGYLSRATSLPLIQRDAGEGSTDE